ncbi:hypothetical protein CAMP5118_05060 [Campylobacter sp. LMG 7929]|uniref:hypothetical protein n=1 Tax=unclassified Campylobacter TaxID=2593542 RepID=UPI0017E27EE2|nr:hypothetical protein [Campylobacter sp. RKI_CA19_01116]EAI5466767.1 hypothetical protein [Campylobacter lari]MCR8698209.1 hypothetical protein [Campylobacter sp. LMG 7929]EGK7485551.1 hypothetical protein [Campylobacter lari]MCV3397291.1 hypothetical protein [Campylobacter sp. RKI_CA19_01116]MCV3446052.1 hypothetical protein [Campylobacter lari]
MSFLDELKDIKKALQKEQGQVKKEKVKASKSGVSMKNTDLDAIQKDLAKQNEDKKQEQEFEDMFLKEERLANEFMEFVKNSDIKKI